MLITEEEHDGGSRPASDAGQKLQASLESLDPGATKQRTVLLADIATTRLGEPEHAASMLNEALIRDQAIRRHREMAVIG